MQKKHKKIRNVPIKDENISAIMAGVRFFAFICLFFFILLITFLSYCYVTNFHWFTASQYTKIIYKIPGENTHGFNRVECQLYVFALINDIFVY